MNDLLTQNALTGSEIKIGDEFSPKVLSKLASKKNPSLPNPLEVLMLVIPGGRQQFSYQNLKVLHAPGRITYPLYVYISKVFVPGAPGVTQSNKVGATNHEPA